MQISEALAKAFQEALLLSHSDIAKALSDELKEMFPDQWCYVCDVYGDAQTGDVVYSCSDGTFKAPYEMGDVNGQRTCAIDDDMAVEVIQRTVYDEEADEDEHFAAMTPAQATEARKLTSDERRMIFTERFVSKAERDAAGSGDFAGKGKSFPILKPGDVMAAVRSMGRAGADNKGSGALKASIIRIAKKKGWAKYLPKAWQDGETPKESIQAAQLAAAQVGEINLVESAATLENIVLQEARADYEIKLIAPGKGSSAFYPAEVLKRDGPSVFKANTHVYLNHQTLAEEAARPENDVRNLAGVLTTSAVYHESHTKGPGLYARMKVFADHGQMVEEKAPHVGMSIRASGIAESGKSRDGLPVLKQLTAARSVDVVTQAGAGGMILTESAKAANQQENEMDEAAIKKLVESAVKEAVAATLASVQAPVKVLENRFQREDATTAGLQFLADISIKESSKRYIVDTVLRDGVPLKEGAIDSEKLKTLVEAEAKRFGEAASAESGGFAIRGMGIAPVVPITETRKPEEIEAHSLNVFKRLGLSEAGAKNAVRGRVA